MSCRQKTEVCLITATVPIKVANCSGRLAESIAGVGSAIGSIGSTGRWR